MKKMSILSRIIIGIASLSLLITFFLPVWFIFLTAPQYPEGLTMNIWLTKITGQVDIINGLNHYIGMKHINAAMFPEFHYLIYIVGCFILFGLVVAITGKRKLLLAYLILTLLGGSAAIYDFYNWGYQYGHNLDPKAPIQVPGLYYQPPVIGHKKLLNFDAYSYPDSGGWVIISVSAIFFLVWAFEFYRNRKSKTNIALMQKKVITVAAAFLTICAVSCSAKPTSRTISHEAALDLRPSEERREPLPVQRTDRWLPTVGEPGKRGSWLFRVSGSDSVVCRAKAAVSRCFAERLKSRRTVGYLLMERCSFWNV